MARIQSITALPQSLVRYVRESADELRKVSWPDRQTTIRYTMIVVVSSLVVGTIIGGIDYLLTLTIEQVI